MKLADEDLKYIKDHIDCEEYDWARQNIIDHVIFGANAAWDIVEELDQEGIL